MSPSSLIGTEVPRVDGPLKVTGQARYAADIAVSELLHGYVLSSGIARGWIRAIHTGKAAAVPGVVKIYTHENRPSSAWFDRNYRDDDSPQGSPFRPLASEKILYSGQPLALVVASDRNTARYAASLIEVEYGVEPHTTSLELERENSYQPGRAKSGYEPPPKPKGNPDEAFALAPHRIEGYYSTPVQHHNPMEPHASTVIRSHDGHLTIYDKTQSVINCQTYVCKVFKLKKDQVRVLSPFVGGAFGSGLRPQYQLFLAVMAALDLGASVRVLLSRQQMFSFGHRPRSLQKIQMAADSEGQLKAIAHEALSGTSQFEDYVEQIVGWSGMTYACDNIRLEHKIARLDTFTPLDMRAPGATSGVFALETAIDELAVAADMDPLEFRRRNFTARHPLKDKPFSSKELLACYDQAATRFGWQQRKKEPRSMQEGHQLVGWGMATGVWEAYQVSSSAEAILYGDGRLHVSSATADFGTGTYTIMTQIAAATLGLPLEAVSFKLGDSSLAEAPLSGGSFTASSVGTAVKEVCEKVREKVFKLAKKMDGSPFAGASYEDVEFAQGFLQLKANPTQVLSIGAVLANAGVGSIREEVKAIPNLLRQQAHERATHAAFFVEVKVDEDFGTVEVSRLVAAIAAGKIINPLTARSQILGGVVWGLSAALQEESFMDHKIGRFMNHDLAEYHIPVQADIKEIDVIFVDEQDDVVNPLGIKGLGEIGIVGITAAVGNAIFHATGRRLRDLPFTLDKVLLS